MRGATPIGSDGRPTGVNQQALPHQMVMGLHRAFKKNALYRSRENNCSAGTVRLFRN